MPSGLQIPSFFLSLCVAVFLSSPSLSLSFSFLRCNFQLLFPNATVLRVFFLLLPCVLPTRLIDRAAVWVCWQGTEAFVQVGRKVEEGKRPPQTEPIYYLSSWHLRSAPQSAACYALLSFSPHRICVSLKYSVLSWKFICNSIAGFFFFFLSFFRHSPPLSQISLLGVQCQSPRQSRATSKKGRIRLKMPEC